MSPDGNILGVSNSKEELSYYELRMSCKLIKQIKSKVIVNGFQWDKGEGRLLFVVDETGTVNIYDGKTFDSQRLHAI